MTNAGKTHTIQGTAQNPGILPRLVSAVFDKLSASSSTKSGQWEMQTSMLEIYQEKIYDLLDKKVVREKLGIRDGNGKVEVCKLSSHPVASSQDALRLMDSAAMRRTKSKTLLNSGSSRSHAIYSITLLARSAGGKDVVSVFQVVDLAGAERGNRTKATLEQQKEANCINTSLMQLFRCLQGMKKKGSGEGREENNIIPFRESKLTHLLMPFLNKASLAGAAMLACVNPQGDDYDETISVLGNASMACKIKEISDVGRVGATAASTQRTSAGEDRAAEGGPKKRRAEGSVGIPAAHANKRGSAAATIKASTSTSNIENDINIHSSNNYHNHSVKNVETEGTNAHLYNEIKNLRAEISRLKAENHSLIVDQMHRETEIRSQVSEEMAKRSNYLLEQIQELQEQLYSKASTIDNVTKSCKKARKRQIELANESTGKDLQEAEEELERVKTQYELEIAAITGEKAQIEAELAQWRAKAESLTKLNHSLELANTQFGAEKGLYPYVEALGTAVVVKNEKDADASLPDVEASCPLPLPPAPLERQRSSRSPLASVGNSPLNQAARSLSPMKGKDGAAAKKSVSPMKEFGNKRRSKDNSPTRNVKKHRKSADENSDSIVEAEETEKTLPGGHAGTYLKKLRSHFIRV